MRAGGIVDMFFTAVDQKSAVDVYKRQLTYSDMVGIMGMGWWMDPLILGKIPAPLKDTITEEDIKIICQPLDLYAGNVYFSANYSDMPNRQNPLAVDVYKRQLIDRRQ